MIAYPVAVPEHVTAALRSGEDALLDIDTGEWFGLAGNERRSLSSDRGIVELRPGVFECTRCRAAWGKGRGGELHEATCANYPGSLPVDRLEPFIDEMRHVYASGGPTP